MVSEALFGMLSAGASLILPYVLFSLSGITDFPTVGNIILIALMTVVPMATSQTQVGIANGSEYYHTEIWIPLLAGLLGDALVYLTYVAWNGGFSQAPPTLFPANSGDGTGVPATVAPQIIYLLVAASRRCATAPDGGDQPVQAAEVQALRGEGRAEQGAGLGPADASANLLSDVRGPVGWHRALVAQGEFLGGWCFLIEGGPGGPKARPDAVGCLVGLQGVLGRARAWGGMVQERAHGGGDGLESGFSTGRRLVSGWGLAARNQGLHRTVAAEKLTDVTFGYVRDRPSPECAAPASPRP